jgi:hypothetical protein
MLPPLDHERREIQVPTSCIALAAQALIRQGVSVYWREDSLSALIQLGARGASDRAAILLVEMSLASQPEELKSWLEMCWRLPSHRRELLQVRG